MGPDSEPIRSGPLRPLTRREALRAAALAGAGAVVARAQSGFAARPRAAGALPTADALRADVQRMVDFGPRLTGTAAHDRYVDWLEAELDAAGCSMLPRDEHDFLSWESERVALELLGGPAAGAARVASAFPRSQQTGPGGMTGPLVYAGTAPIPSVSSADGLATVQSALDRYPAELAGWAAGLGSLPGGTRGAILLVDLPLMPPLVEGVFLALAEAFVWPGHDVQDIATRDFKRVVVPAVAPLPLGPFQALGAAGVVFILDASPANASGQYIPFLGDFQPIPALWVDRDEGHRLREAAASRPPARLTLTGTRRHVRSPSLVGVLPGTSDDVLVLNTHTDGQNFVEENGGVILLHLARYFASRPASERLRHTLVFSAVTGHMSPALGRWALPQTLGFINAHPEIMCRTTAAVTVEHFGCSEWNDSPVRGYHATGDPELFFAWTSLGPTADDTLAAARAAGLPHTLLLRPPVQLGIGADFQRHGTPQVGMVAGPTYLVAVADNGHMDKFDAELAARQTAATAELLRRLDSRSQAELVAGDPSLIRPAPGSCPPLRVPPRSTMDLALDPASARGLRRTRRLSGRLTLNRAGRVRLRATLQRLRGRSRLATRLTDRVVSIRQPGRTRFRLPLTRRGSRELARGGRLRLSVTARFNELHRNPLVRSVTRRLRR